MNAHDLRQLGYLKFGDLCLTSKRRRDVTNDIVVITGSRAIGTFVRCWSPGYYAVSRDTDIWRAAHELEVIAQ